MARVIKRVFILGLLAVVGFLVWENYQKNSSLEDPELLALRQSIAESVLVSPAPGITDAERVRHLADLETAQSALKNSGYDNLQALSEVARLKKLLGDVAGAVNAWKYATKIKPHSAFAFQNLAVIYHYDLMQYFEAEANYLKALVNDPSDLTTIRNLFELYNTSLNNRAKAEGLLVESLKNNPEAADLYALLGKFYQDLNRKDQAIEYYQKHLKLNPNNPNVLRELEKLEKGQ